MWNRCDFPNASYRKARSLQRPYRGFSSGARSFDKHIHLSQALVHPLSGRLLCGSLSRKGRPLSGTFEARCTCAGGHQDIPLGISQGDQGVIKS